MKLYYPFKPFQMTQRWGNPNGIYAAQFGDPNFQLHNGIDARPNFHQKTFPVYCPVEDFYVEQVRWVPTGGGNELWLRSKNELEVIDKTCFVRLILCHGEKILVKAGHQPKVGELLMIGDSTGFSTGPHLHLGMYRIDKNGNKLDSNKATGSYDPGLFFTGQYATDKADVATLITSNLRYYAYIVGLG